MKGQGAPQSALLAIMSFCAVDIYDPFFFIDAIDNSVLVTQTNGVEASQLAEKLFARIGFTFDSIFNYILQFGFQPRCELLNILQRFFGKSDFIS
jgi:hypothetical protein